MAIRCEFCGQLIDAYYLAVMLVVHNDNGGVWHYPCFYDEDPDAHEYGLDVARRTDPTANYHLGFHTGPDK